MRRSVSGFSMVELMVVLSVAGILAAIGIPSYMASIRQAEVRAAASMLANDLRSARTAAQRDNLNVIVSLGQGGAYTLTVGAAQQRRVLPHGMAVRALAGGTRIDYFAPFGETDSGARSWQVFTPTGTRQSASQTVNAVGVTGRVNVVRGN